MAMVSKLSVQEVEKHKSAEDCWIVVNGKIWDVTEFLPEHPGGSAIILKYAGRDATAAYNSVHAPSVIGDNLEPSKLVGIVDESTIGIDTQQSDVEHRVHEKPPLHTLLSTYDFEEVAARTLSKKAWAFYSSAATDVITAGRNKEMFDRIWFRPRILRNVRDVDCRTEILGCSTTMPLFVSPAAMAKLAHPDGELAIARACKEKDIIQCISTNASYPLKGIVTETPNHAFFFQLYVNKSRSKSEALLQQCARFPNIKAIFVTVDAPVAGKREADERVKADESLSAPISGSRTKNDIKGGGLGRLMGGYVDAALCWEDLKWLRRHTKLPIVLKGIQTAEDSKLAMDAGVDGILLSNHGGRSLDTSPPSVLVLLELHRCCPEVFDHLEVYVDGGIRRGTDILKAICLGARAVGIGRHFLYALNYGQEGVEYMIDVLRDELETSMRMVGITDLSQAHAGLVNTLDIDGLVPTLESTRLVRPLLRKARL